MILDIYYSCLKYIIIISQQLLTILTICVPNYLLAFLAQYHGYKWSTRQNLEHLQDKPPAIPVRDYLTSG